MPRTLLAIATTDGVSVCDHLARSAAVVIFEINDGAAVSTSLRSRDSGPCGNHGSFLDLLAGCDTVICGGIGQGAANALTSAGLRSIVLAGAMSIEDAAAGYLAGSLITTDEKVCLCG
jgi:predicted Fe-Mo cluster-binding NifX family protein